MADGVTCSYGEISVAGLYGDDTYGVCNLAPRRACVTQPPPATALPAPDDCDDFAQGCGP